MYSTSRHFANRAFAAHRFFSIASSRNRSPFGGPSPPRLPEEEQQRFEDLQRASTGAFSTPRPQAKINQSPASSNDKSQLNQVNQASATISKASSEASGAGDDNSSRLNARVRAEGGGEELHPNVRRGAPPEFEGDINPKTGEVGGPKNNPLRWGSAGDWSYNGRATDF